MRVLSIAILLIFCACQSNKLDIEPPKDLIIKKEFISILIELETLEAYYEQKHKQPYKYKTALDSSCILLLQEKGFTKNQFEKSINYYSSYPDSMYSIYEASLDSVNNMVNSIR